MDAREPSSLDSSEHSGMLVAHSYESGAGVPGHSFLTANSAGMMSAGMCLPFNNMSSSTSKLLDASGLIYPGDGVPGIRPGNIFSMSEPMKKKRGRPRKYGPDGAMPLALCTNSSTEYNNTNTSLSEPMVKRRGRPPGPGKRRKLDDLGSSGTSFTPHVITVKAGEDVASKITAFSQQGPRTVCILSANGAICNVTLRRPSASGGTMTYEGRFEIISLSGSFLLTENDDICSSTGGLIVEMAGPDGLVLGGGVAGILMAATPVQVVVGSFLPKKKKLKPVPFTHETSSAPPQISGFGVPSASISPSPESSSHSDDDRRSPINHNSGNCNNYSHQLQGLPLYSVGWPNAGN